ncbi:hypothetical protein HXA34_11575 [Salipaludibacillus agaradhaerens]|uniref:hypothetical protein n=1 Tax=Salipaludibacillus agaradhaerens TaxID=76935 RepID=UPI002151649C|nr:hypothetical protein [Salipaludibacillus agaradhaerens]MCR6106928.1 hypothetical protein [Salipaludibacillus agaradhaerens]MCR6118960.1 hypothetical protein [Salipaludibacillus agaradhaerens]
MRLDSNLKRNQLPQHFLSLLSFIDTANIKFMIVTLTLVVVDIPAFYLFFIGDHILPYYIIAPLLLLLHIWMLRLLCKNSYSIQFESILFVCVSSGFASCLYLIILQIIPLSKLGIEYANYYIFSTIIYLIIIILFFRIEMKKYADTNKEGKKDIIYGGGALASVPGIGYLFSQIIIRESEFLIWTVLFFCFLIMYFFSAYLTVKFTYKALFMKVNWHLVVFQKPLKGDQQKFREKGLILK